VRHPYARLSPREHAGGGCLPHEASQPSDGPTNPGPEAKVQQQQEQHADGSDDHVNGPPAAVGPVDVFKMQPERELVERQRRADPEAERQRRRVAPPGNRQVTADEEQNDAGNEVMHVHAAHDDVADAASLRCPDEVGGAADNQEGHHEPKKDEKARLAPAGRYVPLVGGPNVRQQVPHDRNCGRAAGRATSGSGKAPRAVTASPDRLKRPAAPSAHRRDAPCATRSVSGPG